MLSLAPFVFFTDMARGEGAAAAILIQGLMYKCLHEAPLKYLWVVKITLILELLSKRVRTL